MNTCSVVYIENKVVCSWLLNCVLGVMMTWSHDERKFGFIIIAIGDFHLICKLVASIGQKNVNSCYVSIKVICNN